MATEALARLPVVPAARRRREALLGAGAAVWLLATVRAVDPRVPRVPRTYPSCPFHALTGVYCPGCGSLRALADLVHGNLLGAVDHNAMLIAFLPLALLAWVGAMTGRVPRSRPWQVPALVAALIAWTVLRNLPVAPFAVLAP